MFNRPVK